jgi:hypothetical protein
VTEEKPTAAFVLSLVAGVFILLGGGMMLMFGSFMGSYGFGMMSGYGGFVGMMGYGRYPFGVMSPVFGVIGVFGLIFGAVVIIGAVMLNKKPAEHSTWGTVIVVFSVLSIFGSAMGGFGVGLILGLIGGILGITWKPPEAKT